MQTNKVKLFSPYTIKGLTLKNRIVVSPMCQYSSADGFFNDWHLVHLGGFAVGGCGVSSLPVWNPVLVNSSFLCCQSCGLWSVPCEQLVFTEATAVEPIGRISPHDTGIWKDEHLPMLQKIVHFIHEHSAAAGIQIAHAGMESLVLVLVIPLMY